jgi:beta-N-acetylhexosaminidase
MIADAVSRARQRDLIIVTTSSACNDPGQRDLVAALGATGRPMLVVALRDAYDIACLPGIDSYLATYSSASVSIESALRVITGENPARGKLPVDITDPADPGTVIYPYGTGLGG